MKNLKKYIIYFMVSMMALVGTLSLGGCTSKVVPPGTVIIVLKSNGESSIYTKGSYVAWGRDRVYFVDTKWKSFAEKNMKILCADDINMIVDIKWVGSFQATKDDIKIIKERVPATKIKSGDIVGFQLSLNQFYKTAMRDIIRANTRSIISKYKTDNIREKRDIIQKDIKTKIITRFKELGFPIVTTDIMISNIDYPPEITKQRKAIKNAELEDQKQAALAKAAIAQAKRQAGIAVENGKAQIARAKADAKANEIRAKSLTPEIIAMRQWDVFETLAGKKGDLMIVPYTTTREAINAGLIGKRMKIPTPAK
jgi:regulator of protease activity HflC (stomatin/prohibitin superfamily)